MNPKPLHSAAYLLSSLLLCLVLAVSCKKNNNDDVPGQETNVTIRFTPVVRYDSVQMYFDTTTYRNIWNESFIVKDFKFYIRAIRFTNTAENKAFETIATTPYLINCRDSLQSEVKIGVLPYRYNRISFLLGVDSAQNVSGAQTGALDPTHGMFWTWNNGYIFAKFEGTSPSAGTSGNMFQYHIGGFKKGEDVTKEIQLFLPFGNDVNVVNGRNTTVNITADVYDWFSGPHDIKIAQQPGVMTPGPLAVQIAENYSKMFTVMNIQNK